VADVYLRDRERWGKTVMFFFNLRQCFECAQMLTQAGVACEVVHGGSDQEGQLERFRHGDLTVLLNVLVLTEGMDCPDLKTVFVRPGSKGPVMQMTGRALRKHHDKPFAQVVQNHRTRWPFTKIASAEQKFSWENDHWHNRVSVTERMTQATSNTLIAIASIDVKLPPRLSRHKPRRAFPTNHADAA
jgi:superfamily II DNA or RNA helicase